MKTNNVVWIDNPAGIGYSICAKDGCKNNDNQTGVDNLLMLEKFYERFPELKANDLYLSGESYAGIYVP
jgi:carboxypeptidase C (cathepsin A)